MVNLGSGGRAAALSLCSETAFPAVTVPMDTLNPAIVDIAPEGLSLACAATGPQLGLNEPEETFQGPLMIHLDLVQVEGPIGFELGLESVAHLGGDGDPPMCTLSH